jgi:hypothetical protein
MLRFWPSPGQRHGVFVDATLDPAESCLRATLRLEQAATTVARARKIQKRLPIVDKRARRSEGLACWADVYITLLFEREVFPGRQPIHLTCHSGDT